MKAHQILVNSNCYHGFSIDEAIDETVKAGYTGIELTATLGWTEHVFPTMPFKELVRIKNKLKQNNLEVIAMSGHTNLMDNNRLDDFINNIYLANFFGCQFIVSSIGEAHLEDKAHLGNEQLVENIKQLIPILKDNNLTLVIEVHGKDHGTGKIINEIVEMVNDDQIKICYDTANALFYGDVDLLEDMEACIDNIAYIHIKDKAGERTEWNFPAIGKGYVQFDQILELLKKHDNHAPLSIEIEFTSQGPENIEEVNQALVDSKEELTRLGVL